jgi:hypothetical protein
VRFVVLLIFLFAACSSADTTGVTQETPIGAEPISVSMSLYILDDADGGTDSPLSSGREIAEIEAIAVLMNEIWAQAGIELDVKTVARIDVPTEVLIDLGAGDTSSFLNAANAGTFTVPDPSIINGFYLGRIGTANGLTPLGTRIFFVADEPTVNDERVSSHELGHIFGLHHVLDDADRLMFSGTNGTDINEQEQVVTRYAVTGILDGTR